jgi:DNA-binding IscR family transcriptional regulator
MRVLSGQQKGMANALQAVSVTFNAELARITVADLVGGAAADIQRLQSQKP